MNTEQNEEYWLFTILRSNNTYINCFFDYFPSKRDLKKSSNGEAYVIIHTMQLTKEQFNKLTEE